MIDKYDQVLESEKDNNNENIKLHEIKTAIHQKLLKVLNLNEAQHIPLEQLHEECSRKVDALLSGQQYPLSGPEKQQLLNDVMDEVFGYGPIGVFCGIPR